MVLITWNENIEDRVTKSDVDYFCYFFLEILSSNFWTLPFPVALKQTVIIVNCLFCASATYMTSILCDYILINVSRDFSFSLCGI